VVAKDLIGVFMKKRLVPACLTVALISGMTLQAFANPTNVILDDQARRDSMTKELISEDFQSKLDILSNSQRVTGNQAQLLISGQMSYPVRFKLIDNAKKSILISTFSIYSGIENGEIKDETTKVLVEKLIKAKNERGVDVRIIVDGGTSVLAQSTLAIQTLRDAGITVVKYNPIVSKSADAPLLGSVPFALGKILQNMDPISGRWHEKTMIVDGQYLISGGLNWGEIYGKANALVSSAYSTRDFTNTPLVKELGINMVESWGETSDTAWRDTDVLIKGPVVAQATAELLKDFLLLEIMDKRLGENKYKNATDADYAAVDTAYAQLYQGNPQYFHDWSREVLPRGNANMRYISQRPKIDQKRIESASPIASFAKENKLFVADKNPHLYMTNYYVNAINKAEKQILWGCHSNRPTDKMLEALSNAAKRGVKVVIMGNSPESAKNLPDYGMLMYPLALCHYRPLLKGGNGNIRIFEWQKSVEREGRTLTAGAFHSKVFSVDGVVTSVGSYNMSKASWGKHTEGTIVVTDPAFAKKAEEMFQIDLGFSKELQMKDLDDARCAIPGAKFIGGAFDSM
ncbi:MAG: phosphatidylserine/phosphatidylglycerophosphate/cardiolipin synthase family protein, partial [Bdellovibrionota bacterium]